MIVYFLVIFFDRYKEYIICLISFSKFSDLLPAFSAIVNLWSIYLGVNTLSCLRSETLAPRVTRSTQSKIFVSHFPCFPFRNILISKVFKNFLLPLRSIIAFLWVGTSFFFYDWFFWFCRFWFFKNINIIF